MSKCHIINTSNLNGQEMKVKIDQCQLVKVKRSKRHMLKVKITESKKRQKVKMLKLKMLHNVRGTNRTDQSGKVKKSCMHFA